jgi:hypothetical protein
MIAAQRFPHKESADAPVHSVAQGPALVAPAKPLGPLNQHQLDKQRKNTPLDGSETTS